MKTIKDRIVEYVLHIGVSNRQFEIECNLSNGTINNIKDGISSPNLEKIFNRYPNLSLEWLVTGQGNMLKSASSESLLSSDKEQEYKDAIKELETEIVALKAENKVLRELAGLGERKDSNNKSA